MAAFNPVLIDSLWAKLNTIQLLLQALVTLAWNCVRYEIDGSLACMNLIDRSFRGEHGRHARGVPPCGVDTGHEEAGGAGGAGAAFRGVCPAGGRHRVKFPLSYTVPAKVGNLWYSCGKKKLSKIKNVNNIFIHTGVAKPRSASYLRLWQARISTPWTVTCTWRLRISLVGCVQSDTGGQKRYQTPASTQDLHRHLGFWQIEPQSFYIYIVKIVSSVTINFYSPCTLCVCLLFPEHLQLI